MIPAFKMRNKTLKELARMICGEEDYFKYRTWDNLHEFVEDCQLDQFVVDGHYRKGWVANFLRNVVNQPVDDEDLPSREFQRVILLLMDKSDADEDDPERVNALGLLNRTLATENLEAFYADDDRCYVRCTRTGNFRIPDQDLRRAMTAAERRRQKVLERFLDNASEDEFLKEILEPLFLTLRFEKVSVAGHKDKLLEYGIDMWMKFQLPTRHWLYFALQAKKGKVHSNAKSDGNVAEILRQTTMMLGHAIFDPEINTKRLVDHAIIAAGGDITKQAKHWIWREFEYFATQPGDFHGSK